MISSQTKVQLLCSRNRDHTSLFRHRTISISSTNFCGWAFILTGYNPSKFVREKQNIPCGSFRGTVHIRGILIHLWLCHFANGNSFDIIFLFIVSFETSIHIVSRRAFSVSAATSAFFHYRLVLTPLFPSDTILWVQKKLAIYPLKSRYHIPVRSPTL